MLGGIYNAAFYYTKQFVIATAGSNNLNGEINNEVKSINLSGFRNLISFFISAQHSGNECISFKEL